MAALCRARDSDGFRPRESAGDQDLQCPPWVMRRQLARIPGAEFIALPEASHSINWEQPEAVNRNVLEFIGRH